MKIIISKMMIALLLVTFVGAAILSVKYMSQITKELSVQTQNVNAKEQTLYHFMIITNKLSASSKTAFLKGVVISATKYHASFELNEINQENSDEQIRAIDIAIASKADAIIVQGNNGSDFNRLIEKAITKGIPIITIFQDAVSSRRLSYIGVNPYELGTNAAQIAIEAVDNQGNMAIIFDNEHEQQYNTSKNIIEAGIRDILKSEKGMNLTQVKLSETGALSAAEITKELINNNEAVHVIYCASPADTIGVAQVIVDFNKVGKIQVIGTGDDSEILSYIKKGVVYASLYSDIESIGEQCIESAVTYLEVGSISDYEDTAIDLITEENVANYIEREDGNHE